MSQTFQPYLARSFALHLAACAAFLFMVPRSRSRADKVYTIDFVGGPAATIVSAAPASAAESAPAPSAPARVAPQADPDSVAIKGAPHIPFVLPRPSLLRGEGTEEEAGTAPSKPASLAGPGAKLLRPSAFSTPSSAGAGVSTDMPNFPYPWYISQVRLMLWQAWQKRMPHMNAEGTLSFSIRRNGAFTDLSVESSSGDRDFDQAALASVQAAAPFPALPSAFREPFLNIHLALKSQ